MKCLAIYKFFSTLANKTRAEIIEALLTGQLSVSELCKKTGEEQSKISHNLRILRECRIVSAKKKGKERIYALNKKTIIPLMVLVRKHVAHNCKAECWKLK